jgi:EAL domain-containing protein (putative c-di-GMP-specific phosphodiesterase class I)
MLKIDRSFIGRIGAGGENSEIVRTIITLANNLGMHVVAEGVETEAQLAHLRALGCAYGQGYLFSRPVESAQAAALLSEGIEAARAAVSGLADETLNDADTISSYIN